MTIDDDHKYHGAALIQIAEDRRFTAINSLKSRTGLENAYLINDSIGVYLKYATSPKGSIREYQFTFAKYHLAELEGLSKVIPNVFVALVCVAGREICALSHKELKKLVEFRWKSAGYEEDQYVVLVTMPPKKAFQVYVNAAGVRMQYANTPLKIRRNAFPDRIFA